MSRLDSLWTGLALGLFTGGAHLAWAALVATGAAPWVMNVVFRLHFIRPPFQIDGFDPIVAAWLVGLTALGGFAFGWLFAAVWNALADLRAGAPFRQAPR